MAERTDNLLDRLFPLPSAAPSPLCPERFPGITHASKIAVAEALKANHLERHSFTNEHGFHNGGSHASHHLLAAFALGAPARVFNAIYEVQIGRTRPASNISKIITRETFWDHLGDRTFYEGYLQYFSDVVLKAGAASAIEEYIFTKSANFHDAANVPRRMLNRHFAMLYHPMIYLAYGLEFGIPGLVAEALVLGLAQTAVHPLQMPGLISLSDFEEQDTATDRTGAQAEDKTSVVKRDHPNIGVHAFTVLARFLQDDRFSASTLGLTPHTEQVEALPHYSKVGAELSDAILSYTEDWLVDGTDAGHTEQKIEELCWAATLMYGVCGWGGRKQGLYGEFNNDFFHMHGVTSCLFLQTMVTYLSPSSASLFLRTYFRMLIAWWVSRGRPAFPIREFYTSVPELPRRCAPDHMKLEKGMFPVESTALNAWLPLIQMSIMHTDDHLCKTQRALAHFASQYGERPAGYFAELTSGERPSLDGIELLDGTLFLRVAGLTAERVAAAGEDRSLFWDVRGFFV
ncbi:hypothetical protein IEO21_04684 [Rhodonia placenta]|uniref:Uncharacterized protein n=1 Tax=Rhodonia placenta TaxID=104341 RepID=A0A8H7P3J0_9APHY|nr:hypothetical protein IEO21_04684 [Postia placenta]